MKKLPENYWLKYMELLPQGRRSYRLPLPERLPLIGKFSNNINSVPSEIFVRQLKAWLKAENISKLIYFVTEGSKEDFANFEIYVEELDSETVSELSHGCEGVLTEFGFNWAIFFDSDGFVNVAGNIELYNVLHLSEIK